MSQASRKRDNLQALKDVSAINQRIRQAYNVGQQQGIFETVNLLLWVLHSKEGYGKKRLTRIYNELVYLSECVNDEKTHLRLDDIKEQLAEECGIRVGGVKVENK